VKQRIRLNWLSNESSCDENVREFLFQNKKHIVFLLLCEGNSRTWEKPY